MHDTQLVFFHMERFVSACKVLKTLNWGVYLFRSSAPKSTTTEMVRLCSFQENQMRPSKQIPKNIEIGRREPPLHGQLRVNREPDDLILSQDIPTEHYWILPHKFSCYAKVVVAIRGNSAEFGWRRDVAWKFFLLFAAIHGRDSSI